MGIVASFLRWVRKLLDRRRARALLRQGLPRGITAPELRPALRCPIEESSADYCTIPGGAEVIRGAAPRRLLRLAALPPRLPELSVVRPDRLRIDEELRVAAERGAPATAADAPPPAPVRVPPRPRTPLPRAPLSRVDPRAFRLDGKGFRFASEEPVATPIGAVDNVWLHPALRRALLGPPRIVSRRRLGMSPFAAEWFALWWAQHKSARHGAGEPKQRRTPRALAEWMEEVKEQMLIRRDVVKDEAPPPKPRLQRNEAPRAIAAHAPPDVAGLVPPKTWIEPVPPWPEPPPPSLQSAEAYSEWRTFVDALADG
jgi:hypothetical protein